MNHDERGVKSAQNAIAVVGVSAILPDAPDAASFWQNIVTGRYSITEVPHNRWKPSDHYDPDPKVPDKTYCKLGAFIRDYKFDSLKYRIPPPVAALMDPAQQWMLDCARQALIDSGHPDNKVDPERIGVIVGNALGGEQYQETTMRMTWPYIEQAMLEAPEFASLSESARKNILAIAKQRFLSHWPPINADTMPGELGNVIAGRVTNVLDLRGPNFATDAACASSLAALDAAIGILIQGRADAMVLGGVDRTMSPATFVKFSKIGALSPDGSRPFDVGANGFVMGEGCVALVLRRLADAERDGARIYGVIRAIGASSDGKGKGITAPNPKGQVIAIRRAYEQAGISPATIGLIEAHGTSTKVGDAAEAECLGTFFEGMGLPTHSIALGSVKSQIGHLKSAAGTAGLLKAVFALHHKILPPTINVRQTDPDVHYDKLPIYINQEVQPWERPNSGVRRAAVSSFGFGGTNFHVLLEEHVPGMLKDLTKVQVSVPGNVKKGNDGFVCLGAVSPTALRERLQVTINDAERVATGPSITNTDICANERIAITFSSASELADKAKQALNTLDKDDPQSWRFMRNRGIYRGQGQKPKIAFLFPGQGSQYLGMLQELRDSEPEVRATFDEADATMAESLKGLLSNYIYAEKSEAADDALRDTAICQPAMLAADIGLYRLLARYGINPDLVMGHSLGEYAALVAAGMITFANAVRAVSARAREMSNVSIADNGRMASIFAPYEVVEQVLNEIDGYVVPANFNGSKQTVIGGATKAVEEAVAKFTNQNIRAVLLPVSHAFHTEIVAPASKPLRQVLSTLDLQPPKLPIISNVTAQPYPKEAAQHEERLDLLGRQVASPVQFTRGLKSAYQLGVRIFVEVGPRKVLATFVEDVLGDKGDVIALCTNQPKVGQRESFIQALAGLAAAGFGTSTSTSNDETMEVSNYATSITNNYSTQLAANQQPAIANASDAMHLELGRAFARFLEEGTRIYQQAGGTVAANISRAATSTAATGSIVVSGASLGLPGRTREVFSEDNFDRILRGESFIEPVPQDVRERMAKKRITRLVKGRDGSANLEAISDPSEVIKLAGQMGHLDLINEFGIDKDRVAAFDITTKLAVGAAITALRDAGIPLVRRYRQTSRGTYLPERWVLPDSLMDETGVVFASAWPAAEAMLSDSANYYTDKSLRDRISDLMNIREQVSGDAARLLDEQITALTEELEKHNFTFDRRYIFRSLAMGHSQVAELIGARGPNVQVNAACASAATAMNVATEWIRNGRCRRVIVVSADATSTGHVFDWIGAGMLATGAATAEADVTKAALPFDRRRNGMIIGMGASGLIVEAEDAVRERGMRGIVEILGIEQSNSAFHGTRLDVDHISAMMERLITSVEQRYGINRADIAKNGVFVSHETYTPARGGSAAAEIHSVRRAFKDHANEIIIANTKGMTGHAMGAGVEEAVTVKILETGNIPALPNLREPDPDLGQLKLSMGGQHKVRYAVRFAAGFGSQLVLSVFRKVRGPRQADKALYQQWVEALSGRPGAVLEVEQKTLRVRDDGPPKAIPATSRWSYGLGPSLNAEVEGVVGSSPTITPAAFVPTSVVMTPVQTAPVINSAASLSTPVSSVAAPTMAVAAPASTGDAIADKLLAAVAQKTGYPTSMLALDLDLEADLGIDTVKQAEVFSEIRTIFDLPRRDDLRLRDYPTLGHLVRLVNELRPDLVSASISSPTTLAITVPEQTATVADAASVGDAIADKLLIAVADKTGYPTSMLALDLDLEADLGIDTVKQAEIFSEIRTIFDLPRKDDLRLRDYPTLGHLVRLVGELRPDLASAPADSVSTAAPTLATPPASPPISVAAVSGASASDQVTTKLLDMVADTTGYPQEMLALDLDLEADLGIDTVKQAEIFSKLREGFELPKRDDLKLRDYPTLGHLVRLIGELRPELTAQTAVGSAPVARVSATPTTAPASAPQTNTTSTSGDELTVKMLSLVASITGYPQEMLDLDLDLEADLGIDTVKQAEIFSKLREEFALPRRDDLKLRDYPTLAKLLELVRTLKAESTTTTATVANNEAQTSAVVKTEKTNPHVRRVPVPVLRPDLTLCKLTSVKLESGKRVVIAPDENGVASNLQQALSKRGVEVLMVENKPVEEQTKAWLEAGAIDGIFDLSALDPEPDLYTATIEEVRSSLKIRVDRLSRLCRELLSSVGKDGGFIIAATRLGGLHGYGSLPALAPAGGAITGFIKAIGREQPQCLVKAVDFSADSEALQIVATLIYETERDPEPVEVGYAFGARHVISFNEVALPATSDIKPLNKDAAIFVTGAAGGITAAIAADIAGRCHGTFYLTDIVPVPAENNPDRDRLKSDREGLKRDIFERHKSTGQRVTPAQIESTLAALEREKALVDAMQAITNAGGRVHYYSADSRDWAAVNAIVQEIKKSHKGLDLIIHAAGLERSRFLAEKSADEFERVFEVKALGLANVLRATKDMPIGAMVCFSSVAGRFGNAAQTDYSSANDFLCKAMSGLAIARPEVRGLAIDWTAWGDVGMATRGSIPEMMRRAGIDVLPLAEGLPVVWNEVTAGTKGEVVIAKNLGLLVAPRDATGGIDQELINARIESNNLPMIGHVVSMHIYEGLRIETNLDPKSEPFLIDHQIDGVPVLPGVMGVEGFVEVAHLLLPEHRVESLENVRFQAPLKYHRHQSRPGIFRAMLHCESDDVVIADITLSSTQRLADGQDHEKQHFCGTVRMIRSTTPRTLKRNGKHSSGRRRGKIQSEDIYRIFFHGPSYQVIEGIDATERGARGHMRTQLPPALAKKGHATVFSPRVIELCLQTAGVYEMGTSGRMALPAAIDKMITHDIPGEAEELTAEIEPRKTDDGLSFDARVSDAKGRIYFELKGYRTSALPTPLPDTLVSPLRNAFNKERA
ncbi:MAG: SDR family NAD(P)-dependent oxidoreductase [Deltaproteobacteria bacterium]|nr:SDR family NAD(P)-dependent oxidoreductase [Deltaproteobacteria bacterium]